MDFFDSLISSKEKVNEEKIKEQEIQEKQEIEKQEKCEFATFLDLKPKSSEHDDTPETPSPKKGTKMNTRKSWEMTDAIQRSPKKNLQYLVKKPRIIKPGAIVPEVEEESLNGDPLDYGDPLEDATATISLQNEGVDPLEPEEPLSYTELQQEFEQLEAWKKTTRRPAALATKALLKTPLSITKTNRIVKPPSRLIQDCEPDFTDSDSDSAEGTSKRKRKISQKKPQKKMIATSEDPLAISGHFMADLSNPDSNFESNLEEFSDPEDAPLKPKILKLDKIVKIPKLISEKVSQGKKQALPLDGRCVLKERTEDNIEYSLPYGWKKIGLRRQGDQDRWDVYLITPCGKKLRSNLEVDRYLEKCPDVDCDREVTNTSKPWADSTPAKPKPKRVRIAKSPDISYHAQEEKVLKSPEKSRRGRTIKPNSRFSDANFEYDFKDKIDSESDLEDILKDEIDNESDTYDDFDDDDKMPDSESEFESDPEEDKFDIESDINEDTLNHEKNKFEFDEQKTELISDKPQIVDAKERPKIIKLTKRFCGKHQLRWYYSSYKKKLRCKGCSTIFETKEGFDQHLRFFDAQQKAEKAAVAKRLGGLKQITVSQTPKSLGAEKKAEPVAKTYLARQKQITVSPAYQRKNLQPSNAQNKIGKVAQMYHEKQQKIQESKIAKSTLEKPKIPVLELTGRNMCNSCNIGFENVLDLVEHVNIKHRQMKPSKKPIEKPVPSVNEKKKKVLFKCSICRKCFGSRDHTRLHLKAMHSKFNNLDDFIHEEGGNSFKKLLDDFVKDEEKSSKKTEIQVKNLETQETIQTLEIPEIPGVLETIESPKKPDAIKTIESPEKPKVTETNDKLECAICDQQFENRTRLTLHIETIHTNALASQGKKKQSDSFKELFCPFCEKNFKDKNEFSGHISKVMYGQCPTGAGYQKIETKSDTSQKTDNVVGESKDRKPKSFKEMLQNVKEKTSTVPKEKETFKCMCGRQFATKKALENHHIEVHEKKKPFQCSICSKAFSSKENIRIHITAVHRRKFNVDDFIHEDKSFDKNEQNNHPKEESSKKNVPKNIEENEAIKNIPKSPAQKNIYEANNLYNPLAKSPAKNISPEKVQIQPEKNIDPRTANHSQSTGLDEMPEVAETTEITETGESRTQINNLGFDLNETPKPSTKLISELDYAGGTGQRNMNEPLNDPNYLESVIEQAIKEITAPVPIQNNHELPKMAPAEGLDLDTILISDEHW